jgi:hypothetical protein
MAVGVQTESTGVPPALAQALGLVGMPWPEGDAGKLAAAGDAWLEVARGLTEQRTAADAAAARVWTVNRGDMIDAFKAWWTGTEGPSTNLANSAQAAQLIAAALKGHGAVVTALKAGYTASLTALANALRTAGPGAPNAQAMVEQTRQNMLRLLHQARDTTTTTQRQLLLETEPKLKPAPERRPTTGPRTGPRTGPGALGWLWALIMWLLRDGSQRRCPSLEMLGLPTAQPLLFGNPDPRTFPRPGWIAQVSQRNGPDGVRVVTIDGALNGTVPPSQNYVEHMRIARDSIGIPSVYTDPEHGYDASHLWGRNFGTEAAAGIYLSPAHVNQAGGIQRTIEDELGRLRQSVEPDGHVLVHAVTTTHPPSAFTQQIGDVTAPVGANLVHTVQYTAVVCRPDGTMEPPRVFGYAVSPPYRLPDGTFMSGDVVPGSVRGVPQPLPRVRP